MTERQVLSVGGAVYGLAVAVLGCGPAGAQPAPGSINRGAMLAKAACVSCHAIAGRGPSPLQGAPPFPTLLQAFADRNIDEIVAQGVMSGHTSMPMFMATPQDIADLTAYVRSVQVRPDARPGS